MEISGPLEPKVSAKAPRWDPGTGCTERTLMLASRLGSEGKRKRSFAVPFESYVLKPDAPTSTGCGFLLS